MYQGQIVKIDIRKISNESISSKVSKTKSDWFITSFIMLEFILRSMVSKTSSKLKIIYIAGVPTMGDGGDSRLPIFWKDIIIKFFS